MILQVIALLVVRGKTWIAVLFPLAVVPFTAYEAFVAYRANSNLWPIGLIVVSAISIGYLTLVIWIHHIKTRNRGAGNTAP